MYPVRVHLTGGESIGWALDADVSTTRDALKQCGVNLVALDEAEVVHGVWELPLLTMEPHRLAGKKILCHLPNDLARTFEQSCMVNNARVGLWIPISRQASDDCAKLGLNHTYVPYAINPSIFTSYPPDGLSRETLRQRWGVPIDRYIISNFMRDSSAADLRKPKPQKGVEVLVDILSSLVRAKLPIHVLLAGPRRHWIRGELSKLGIPFTFVGQIFSGDDNSINILPPETINLLYHASDLHLVTSRWEGGPRAVLEAAATRVPILCPPVGLAPDVLEPTSLIHSAHEAIERIADDIRTKSLLNTIEPQYLRVMEQHTAKANAERFRSIYERINSIPVYSPSIVKPTKPPAVVTSKFRTIVKMGLNIATRKPRYQPGQGIVMSLWHEFHKPPYGGGNQFMLALRSALEKRGVRIRINELNSSVDVHLCNSAWFNIDALRKAGERESIRMIHRIDGPVSVYRGTDRQEDDIIFGINRELATATVFQSAWCYERSLAMGYKPVAPVIFHNAVDDRIFHPKAKPRNQLAEKRVKIVSAAWSDNPRKGLDLFLWLDENLDFSRYEYTFVGRVKASFRNIRHIGPLPSKQLAKLLREQDIYISASRSEPCSNALLEAMACGLPALYMNDGGNPEIVQLGGEPFDGKGDVLSQLNKIAENIDHYRAALYVHSIDYTALRYIDLAREII